MTQETIDQTLLFFLLHPVSHGLSEEESQKVASSGASIRSFAQGETVFSAGQTPRGIWLIISGRLCLVAPDDRSRQPISRFATHDQVGMIELVRGETPTVDLIAEEPTSTLEIPSEVAVRLMESIPMLARNLLREAAVPMTEFIDSGKKRASDKTIAFIHLSRRTRSVSDAVIERLGDLGETVGRITDDPNQDADEHTFLFQNRFDDSEIVEIRHQLTRWVDLPRVSLEFESETKPDRLDELAALLQYVHRAFFVGTPDRHFQLAELLTQLTARTRSFRDKVNVIWVLSDRQRVGPLSAKVQSLSTSQYLVHEKRPTLDLLHYDELPGDLNPGVERVVHAIRGVQIGLALGGGAARGMAHVGVFAALEQSGIVVDRIAGTSVGAMLGVTYSAGYSSQFARQAYPTDLKLPFAFRMIPAGGKLYLVWKYRTRGWDAMLRKYFFDWQLQQLPIPIDTVSADLVSGEEVIRSEFDAVDAITESINLPELSPPYLRDGQVLVDGGILNVIPADTLIRRGCNFVIGVDVASKMEKSFLGNTPETPTEKMRKPSLVSVIRRVRQVQDRNLCRLGSQSADLTIAPDVSHVDIAAFEDTVQTAELGYVASMQMMPTLLRQLHDLDPQLFPLAAGSDAEGG